MFAFSKLRGWLIDREKNKIERKKRQKRKKKEYTKVNKKHFELGKKISILIPTSDSSQKEEQNQSYLPNISPFLYLLLLWFHA